MCRTVLLIYERWLRISREVRKKRAASLIKVFGESREPCFQQGSLAAGGNPCIIAVLSIAE